MGRCTMENTLNLKILHCDKRVRNSILYVETSEKHALFVYETSENDV